MRSFTFPVTALKGPVNGIRDCLADADFAGLLAGVADNVPDKMPLRAVSDDEP